MPSFAEIFGELSSIWELLKRNQGQIERLYNAYRGGINEANLSKSSLDDPLDAIARIAYAQNEFNTEAAKISDVLSQAKASIANEWAKPSGLVDHSEFNSANQLLQTVSAELYPLIEKNQPIKEAIERWVALSKRFENALPRGKLAALSESLSTPGVVPGFESRYYQKTASPGDENRYLVPAKQYIDEAGALLAALEEEGSFSLRNKSYQLPSKWVSYLDHKPPNFYLISLEMSAIMKALANAEDHLLPVRRLYETYNLIEGSAGMNTVRILNERIKEFSTLIDKTMHVYTMYNTFDNAVQEALYNRTPPPPNVKTSRNYLDVASRLTNANSRQSSINNEVDEIMGLLRDGTPLPNNHRNMFNELDAEILHMKTDLEGIAMILLGKNPPEWQELRTKFSENIEFYNKIVELRSRMQKRKEEILLNPGAVIPSKLVAPGAAQGPAAAGAGAPVSAETIAQITTTREYVERLEGNILYQKSVENSNREASERLTLLKDIVIPKLIKHLDSLLAKNPGFDDIIRMKSKVEDLQRRHFPKATGGKYKGKTHKRKAGKKRRQTKLRKQKS